MSLAEKLHPEQLNISPRVAAIVAYIIGEDWTNPKLQSLTITSDGQLIGNGSYLGTAAGLQRDLNAAVAPALNADERAEFERLFDARVEATYYYWYNPRITLQISEPDEAEIIFSFIVGSLGSTG